MEENPAPAVILDISCFFIDMCHPFARIFCISKKVFQQKHTPPATQDAFLVWCCSLLPLVLCWAATSAMPSQSALNLKGLGVSENSGTPKSSILTRFSIVNHPFWGTPIFGNTHFETSPLLMKKHTSIFSRKSTTSFFKNSGWYPPLQLLMLSLLLLPQCHNPFSNHEASL